MENSNGRCLECGRRLQDKLSISRGYGPKCWARNNAPRLPASLRAARPSISNPGLASVIIQKIQDKIVDSGKLCNCGESLHTGELKTYDHSEGYNLRGYSVPQWVYVKCSKCGYEWAIIKLKISLKDLEKKSSGNKVQTELDEIFSESPLTVTQK